MCIFYSGSGDLRADFIYFGIKIFLLAWIIFVPIAMTSRLEKIIKILRDKK